MRLETPRLVHGTLQNPLTEARGTKGILESNEGERLDFVIPRVAMDRKSLHDGADAYALLQGRRVRMPVQLP
jgi:hypothetical protein